MAADTAPLLEQIRSAGSAAADAKLAAARAEADAIRARARDAATQRRDAALAERGRAAAAALERTRADATAQANRSTLGARSDALDQVFSAAEQSFASLVLGVALRELLAAWARDALTYIPEGKAAVRCAASDADEARAALSAIGRDDVTVTTDESVPAGAVVESADGSVAVDCTFARRLRRERARLSIVVMSQLTVPSP